MQELRAAATCIPVICLVWGKSSSDSSSYHESGKLCGSCMRILLPGDLTDLLELLLCWLLCAVLQGVDVPSQAFSVFDPAKSGAADMPTLKHFLKQLHSVEVGAQLHAEPALTRCRTLSRW
jgi:hypothetical protein